MTSIVALVTGITGWAWAAGCSESTTRSDVEEALDRASSAYAAADLRGFEVALEDVRRVVPCLEGPLSTSVVAQLHRVEGLAAFVASDEDRVRQAFGSAKRLEPGFVFPDVWAPVGNPLRSMYRDAPARSETTEAPVPPEGALRFDGRPTRDRPTEHPTVYQWVQLSGNAEVSQYLWPADPLPAYPVAPVEASENKLRVPLLAIGGVALASGVGLLAGASASRTSYDSDTTTLDNVDGRRARTNGLVIGSGIAFAVGVGSGAVGIAVGR